jgi:Asparagine synthase
MTRADRIAEVIRAEVHRSVRYRRRQKIGIALSGGADSCSILAEMLSQKLKPIVVSYTPSTHESTDFKMARATAERFDLPFKTAIVNMDADRLEAGMRYVITRGYSGKIEVESLIPMVVVAYTAKAAGVEFLFTGDQADGYFNNSKSSVMPEPHGKGIRTHTDSAVVDEIRRVYYEKDASCSGAIRKLGIEFGLLDVVCPYRAHLIYDAFKGALWSDVNKPRLKEPIRLAYADWLDTDDAGIPTRPGPVNLHKGDSEFGDTLAATMLALPKFSSYRSPVGLYRAVARGEV